MQTEIEKEDREKPALPSMTSPPEYLQQPGLGQARNKIQISYQSGKVPINGAIVAKSVFLSLMQERI